MSLKKQEKIDVTLCKGLAITLVVIGHLLGRGEPQGHEWFLTFKEYLYLFHMPFFMFLSGYVYFRPGRLSELLGRYRRFFHKQFVRLILPFLAFGLGILILKLVLQHYLHVDNVPEGIADGLYKMFWDTNASPVLFIWYIFVLFVFSVLSPLLYPLLKERMGLWLALGLVVYALPWFPHLYINKMTAYFVFFTLGGFLRHHEDSYIRLLDGKTMLWIGLFALSFLTYEVIDKRLCILLVGVLSVPALHGLCRKPAMNNAPAAILGRESYIIYLFNTLCIGATKAVIFLFSDWNGANFLWVAPLLLIAGLIGPIMVKYSFLWVMQLVKGRVYTSAILARR